MAVSDTNVDTPYLETGYGDRWKHTSGRRCHQCCAVSRLSNWWGNWTRKEAVTRMFNGVGECCNSLQACFVLMPYRDRAFCCTALH